MLATLRKKNEGFTLIEIVLVLAIAGLILLIVFLAVGGAQRARRDQQRKSDNARVAAQLEQFASNNSGCYPDVNTVGCPAAPLTFGTCAVGAACANGTFFHDYVQTANNFTDPLTGVGYGATDDGAAWPVLGSNPANTGSTVHYTWNHDCTAAGVGGRVYAVRITLETSFACNTNH